MMYDLTSWMTSWGWRLGEKGLWEKYSPAGLIIAFQGDSTWDRDYKNACTYEAQLMGTRAN